MTTPRRVVRRYLRNREDALEVVQDAFAKAYRKLDTFDLDRKFSTWVMTVATNRARDLLRRRMRRPEILADESLRSVPGGESPEREASAREEAERLRAAVEELPDDKRIAVVLRYFEGMSLAEVSEVTGVEPNTLKVRLFRARKELMEKLAERE